jgi:hypothetical protein
VLSFAGFPGIGDRYHALPREKLHYDKDMGGYVTDVDWPTLDGAPSYADEAAASWNDDARGPDVYSCHGARPSRDLMP